MGQAKLRGTFEQRQEAAIKARKAREANRPVRRAVRAGTVAVLGMAAILAGSAWVGR